MHHDVHMFIVCVHQTQSRLTSYFPTEMAAPRKLKSKRVKRILNVIRNPDVTNMAVSPSKSTAIAVSKGKSVRGRKPKNSRVNAQDLQHKKAGGFLSKSKPATLPHEVELSESSSCSDELDDGVPDDLLRNIDLESFNKDLISGGDSHGCLSSAKGVSHSKKTSEAIETSRNLSVSLQAATATGAKKRHVKDSKGKSRRSKQTKTAPRIAWVQLSESDTD